MGKLYISDIPDNELVRHYATSFTIQQHYIYDPCTLYICKADADETKILEVRLFIIDASLTNPYFF